MSLELVSSLTQPSTEKLLLRGLVRIRRRYRVGRAVCIDDLLGNLGPHSAVLSSCLLALPFFLPLSLGPITTPASILIMILSWRLMRGRDQVALPQRFLQAPLPQKAHRIMSWILVRMLHWRRKFTRHRLPHFVHGNRGRLVCGAGMLISALLLSVPVPMIPLSNTFPAIGICLFALGWPGLGQD